MQIHGTTIEDTYAEAFGMWASRLIVTAVDGHWLDIAVRQATGYGTSFIGCDAEAGLERMLDQSESPDGRPAAALMFFTRSYQTLSQAVCNRVGQCLMTCPTTAVFDGLPQAQDQSDQEAQINPRINLGEYLSVFGDGYETRVSQQGHPGHPGPPGWSIPVTEGQFVVGDTVGAIRAIGGGNFLVCGIDQPITLAAAKRAAEVIAPLPGVITSFPGGVCRCASKPGSVRDPDMIASTYHDMCPTLRDRLASRVPAQANCVYEIVVNGLDQASIQRAMGIGITAACGQGIVAISAGNYGGKLGKIHLRLHDVVSQGS